jgi:hypothetical protein
MWFVLGALAVGCGDGGGSPTDAAPGGCGAIGFACEMSCADPLVCVSGPAASFCAPARTQCGGFAGQQCVAEGQTCAVFSGDTLGTCLTPAEVSCVCARSPGALGECAD